MEPQFGMSKPNQAGVTEVGPWVVEKIRELKKKFKGYQHGNKRNCRG